METTEIHSKLWEIFCPGDIEKLTEIRTRNRKFAYYTSADTAKKIIQNNEVWLRNATVMNDFLEISYGLDLSKKALDSESGKMFIEAANSVFHSIVEDFLPQFFHWDKRLPNVTYLSSLSLHDNSENQNGRLSMWRAYGDIALIINNTPLMTESSQLGVFSTPVHYLGQREFDIRLDAVTRAINQNKEFLSEIGKEYVREYISSMFFLAAIGTKHPGFKEEQEWRIYFQPEQNMDYALSREIVAIDGVVQEIWKLPLKHDPVNGLEHADLPSLVDRIIIGPTPYPDVSQQAFVRLLEDAGVADAANKVVVADIPLRTRG